MNDIVRLFNKEKKKYKESENKLKDLIESLLKTRQIEVHGIESRVKEEESLIKKIERKQGKYNSLQEITDILGLRIITYFENDVDKIAELIDK